MSNLHIAVFPAFAICEPAGEFNPGQNATSRIRFEANGVILGDKPKLIRRKLAGQIIGRLMDVDQRKLRSETFVQRIHPFLLPPRKLLFDYAVGGTRSERVGKSRRNGQFRIVRNVPAACREGDRVEFHITPRKYLGNASAAMQILPPSGLSVISDIDDTIKYSNVENRAELLANTFLRPFRPIEGMAEVYRRLAGRGAAFHYVTASPWQLHEPLARFLAEVDYPAGSHHYRSFKVRDHLLKRLGVIHRRGKSAAIRRILAACPKRTFLLIGDSGERDAEIYARCYRDFPHLIQKVLIRLVRPDHRFRESILRARIALPDHVFGTFESPDELGRILDEPHA